MAAMAAVGSLCVRPTGSLRCSGSRQNALFCRAETKPSGSASSKSRQTADPGPLLKATWFAAEAFGNLVGNKRGDSATASTSAPAAAVRPKMSRAEVIDSLRRDYAADYFISGNGQMEAYEDDCLFADPFASFRGVERFKRNVANLGGLLQDISIDIYDWREGESEVEARWRFSATLTALPWKPILAAKGRTTHTISESTGLVERHYEAWDTEPWRVVQTLLKPGKARRQAKPEP